MTPTVAFVSFRLGLADGVSVVAETWMRHFTELGFAVRTVAGEGPVDFTVPELALGAGGVPDRSALVAALGDADVVVAENLLTIPLRLEASLAVADVLSGRPAVLHHHDPPWQRAHLAHVTELPPTDPAWEHVVINELTRAEFAARAIRATTIHNGFDVDPVPGDRESTRRALGLPPGRVLALHPVRAIPRKRVDVALAVCERIGATYWLVGAPEDGFGPELERLLAATTAEVRRHPAPNMADAYAACDLVLFPSSWEGFGNPPVEAAIRRRPAVVGDYPVARELRSYGFRWFRPAVDEADLVAFLARPDRELLDHNQAVARRHFSTAVVAGRLQRLLAARGWWRPAPVST